MHQSDVFRINGPQVIYENIDGEVVLINLQRGTYYSTDEVGTDMWSMIEAGLSAGEITAAILARYDGDAARIRQGVSDFLCELTGEELIVASGSEEGRPAASVEAAEPATARPHFQAPILNKYTDMKDMLLLDPIHDVEETGWPTPKASP